MEKRFLSKIVWGDLKRFFHLIQFQDAIVNDELQGALDSCKLLERENQKLRNSNQKLKALNVDLMDSNKRLKTVDVDNFMMNVSTKSNSLIHEIDNIKVVEDLKFELVAKDSELDRKIHRIQLLESEIESKSNTINSQRDDLEAKETVIRRIKSELSSHQLDVAEVKAMMDIERSKSQELERRLHILGTSGNNKMEVEELFTEIKRLRTQNQNLIAECNRSRKEEKLSPFPTSSNRRVTKAYIKFLRSESLRKALVFQKHYLLSVLAKAKAVENTALSILDLKNSNSKFSQIYFVVYLGAALPSIKALDFGMGTLEQLRLIDKNHNMKNLLVLLWHYLVVRILPAEIYNNVNILGNFDKPKSKFKKVSHVVIAVIRLKGLVRKWNKVKISLQEKQKSKATPSTIESNRENRYMFAPSTANPPEFTLSPSSSPINYKPEVSEYSGLPRWDSSRPLTPPVNFNKQPPHLRSDNSFSRLDHQLQRLKKTIIAKPSYVSRDYHDVIPERDTGNSRPGDDSNGAETLSDISSYISRLEVVQSRLTDLKRSSYKLCEYK